MEPGNHTAKTKSKVIFAIEHIPVKRNSVCFSSSHLKHLHSNLYSFIYCHKGVTTNILFMTFICIKMDSVNVNNFGFIPHATIWKKKKNVMGIYSKLSVKSTG